MRASSAVTEAVYGPRRVGQSGRAHGWLPTPGPSHCLAQSRSLRLHESRTAATASIPRAGVTATPAR